jgi:DNA-binding transcriptional MerR regulator
MPARAPGADVEELGGRASGQEAAARAASTAPKAGGPRPQVAAPSAPGEVAARPKSLTIGAVCKALAQEFPDVSISKIRYLEDQKLLAPRRTPGGYRLYTQGDVARLRTILRMQRDEFLPLRVIRQELAAGRSGEETPAPRVARDGMRAWRPSVSVREATGALYSMEDVLEETKAEGKLVRELEEYGVVKGEMRGGVRYFDETEREIIAAVAELARYGVGGRNLRVFRSSADREANLLQQILAPALRSRNPQRRKEAVEALENLAAVATHLKHLLLVRDLRKIVR